MNELTTERTWAAADIVELFRAPGEAQTGSAPVWVGPIRTAGIDAKWPVLIDVVNESRNEDGLPDLGPYDFDIHDEIECAAVMLALASFGEQVGAGRPIAIALRGRTQPTIFCERTTEQDVREAVRKFYPEA